MQSRRHSLLESLVNIAVGYTVAISSQLLIFPLFAINIPLSQNLSIGALFTGVSLVRSYLLRRLFNQWTVRLWHRKEKRYGRDRERK